MNKMYSVHRSPDPIEGGGGKTDPYAGYEETLETAPIVAADPPLDLKDDPAPDPAPEPEGNDAPENNEGDPASKEVGEESEVFGVEDLNLSDDDSINEDEDTYKWSDIAKELDMDLEEDSLEALKTGFKQKEETIKTSAITEYLEKEKKYTPDALKLITALNSGATELGIYEVEKPYRDFLLRSDEEKVTEAYLQDGFSQEYAAEEIDKLIEEGKLEDRVKQINESVIRFMGTKREEYIDSYKQQAADKIASDITKVNAENELISQAILERTEYKGVPLSKELRSKLIARWNNGTYRRAFESNPNAVTDFILNLELGKAASDKRIQDETEGYRKGIQSKLHNLETAQASARRASNQKAHANLDPNDPYAGFDSIDDIELKTSYGTS